MAETRVPEVIQGGALKVLTDAELDKQVATAKRYPREIQKFITEATAIVTRDPELAAACTYRLERKDNREPGGKKIIEGPSVRLAELMVYSFQNCRVGARIIEESDRFVTAQGIAMDLERNTAVTTEVSRRITTREGNRFGDDMIGVTRNAACAIAFRNAVFDMIPLALVKPIWDAAKAAAAGDKKTLDDRRMKMLGYFATVGVGVERLLAAIDRKTVDEITMDDVVRVGAMLQAVNDGDATLEQQFPAPQVAGATGDATAAGAAEESGTKAEKLAGKLKAAKGKKDKDEVPPASEAKVETKAEEKKPEATASSDDVPLSAEELAEIERQEAEAANKEPGTDG